MEATRVPEKSKLANVVFFVKGKADSWLYAFLKQYPPQGRPPSYAQFRAAIINKYEAK